MPLRRFSFSDMQKQDSESSSSGEEDDVRYDQDDLEWEDAEPDAEELEIVSLFDDAKLTSLKSLVDHDKEKYGFDLLEVQKRLSLDFYGRIKLVNYVRSAVASGNLKPDVSASSVFADDKYLQPFLQDDALLFSLDELDDLDSTNEAALSSSKATVNAISESPEDKIKELEAKLAQLTTQFTSYREYVSSTLDARWQDSNQPPAAAASSSKIAPPDKPIDKAAEEGDSNYFDSYSYNDIHETMLKDSIRTNAYRDFIYTNKNLFTSKTVLDVGCGTGILSLFCARAGASKVIGVDNSTIITKAAANVAANGLDGTIVTARGKIEEVTLPVDKVDIIVSEWMGYTLLFEAMLNSVLSARDKYLAPDGLMVPSHVSLHIAPWAEEDYITDSILFWKDVYGFKMDSMTEKIYEEVRIRFPKADTIVGKSHAFRTFDLYKTDVSDLSFSAPFSVTLAKDIDNLDGFALWFDTFFLPGRDQILSTSDAAEFEASGKLGNAFTTSPAGKETHWQAGFMVIDREKKKAEALKAGTVINGSILFKESGASGRGLEIEATWTIEGSKEYGHQVWFVR